MDPMHGGDAHAISPAHAAHAKVLRDTLPAKIVHCRIMSKLDGKEVTRTLTIVLPESEWHALRNVEPDAIGWLQERIRERLGSSSEREGRFEATSRATSESYWGADEY